MNAYAVIERPDHYGRSGWETYHGYQYAKYIAAFYRYTYGWTTEVWTIKADNKLGKCLKRETPQMGTRFSA